MTIQIGSPVDLIASLPALMGFVPGDMYVPIVFTSMDTILLALKVSIEAPESAFFHAREVMEEAENAHHVIVVSIGPDPQKEEFPREQIFGMIPPTMREFMIAEQNMEILAVPSMIPGAPVIGMDHTGATAYLGDLPDWRDQDATSRRVLEGNNILTSELEVYDLFLQDHTPDTAVALGESPEAWARAGFPDDKRPSNAVLGAFLSQGIEYRDWILGQAVLFDLLKVMHEFAAVSRKTEGRARVEALTVAGVMAYCLGKGAHAVAAFQLAKREAEAEGDVAILASLAGTMLINGTPPGEMRKVCHAFRKTQGG